MALKKMPAKPSTARAKKTKQPTQYTALKRVMVMGPTGKIRFEWMGR